MRQSWFIRFVMVILLVVFAIGTTILFYADQDLELAAFIGLLTICLALWVVSLLCSKFVVSEQEIVSYKWFRKKRLKLSDIKAIQHSALWGGSIILRDSRKAITIPTEYAGSAEFVKHLVDKLGSEFCSSATYGIRIREKEMISKQKG
ncbi:hypothetical protein [Paenibacillus solani]|uniref:hypothetical protein n=1 Tax=Paenibacillus solani TaxID=1705565 RepID=UPI003D2901DF